MTISLSITEYVAKKIGKLNGDKLLDTGCREMIVKEQLRGNFNYLLMSERGYQKFYSYYP